MDAASHVGEHGSGKRDGLGHLRVGQGGEDHRNQADEVNQRHHALGGVVDGAKDGPWRDGHHEDQAVNQKVGGGNGAAEFLLVAQGLQLLLCVALGGAG